MSVILLLPLAIGAFAITYAVKHRQRVNAAWSSAASQLGLSARIGNLFTMPELSGAIGDLHVKIKVRSGGDNDTNYTRYEVRHRPAGPPLTLKRQGGFSRIARLFGKRDIEIGDPFFDDRVIIDSPSPEAVREFLTPARQAIVLEVFDRWKNGEIRHDAIVAETQKMETVAATLVATTRRLLDMAAVMGDPGRVDAALTKQLHGDFADGLSELHALNEERPNSFTQMLEAEGLVELGDHETAAEVLDEVDQNLPARVGDQGWTTLAGKPSPVSLPAPPVAQNLAPSQQEVIDDLFDAGRLSFEIVDHFERTYAKTTVHWAGTVTRVNTYRHDSDFGAGPGQKVTVLLGGSGKGNMISNEVHAVIEVAPDVTVQRDTQIPFTGTLIRVDRFARKLYVTDALVE